MRKTVTLLMYGGDRTLWSGDRLTLAVIDLVGGRTLKQQQLAGAAAEIQLDLPFDAGQVYPLTVGAPRHRAAWHLVSRSDFLRGAGAERVERDDTILRLLLVPRPFASSDLAAGWQALQRLGSPVAAAGGLPETDYLTLGTAEQMALLNIEAKLRATYLAGVPILSHVRGVRHIRPDRLFLYLAAEAKELARRSPDFGAAPGHDAPADAPWLRAHPDSWKHQRFVEGNAQISFASDPEPWGPPGGATEACYSADVDIDLGRGLSHAAEWLRNNVFQPGHKTEQDVVYGMLYNQGILPAYTLQPAAAAGRRAAGGVRRPQRARPARKTAARGTRPRRRTRRRSG